MSNCNYIKILRLICSRLICSRLISLVHCQLSSASPAGFLSCEFLVQPNILKLLDFCHLQYISSKFSYNSNTTMDITRSMATEWRTLPNWWYFKTLFLLTSWTPTTLLCEYSILFYFFQFLIYSLKCFLYC